MEFNIQIELRHFQQFQKMALANMRRNSALKWGQRLFDLSFWLLVGLIGTNLFYLHTQGFCWPPLRLGLVSFTAALLLILLLVWGHMQTRLISQQAVRPDGSTLGHWQIHMDEVALTETSAHSTYTSRWPAFISIEKDETNLYLFTDAAKACILPLDQITPEIEAFLRQKIGAGQLQV